MSSYLPKDSSGTYAEGGGLYAVGEGRIKIFQFSEPAISLPRSDSC